MVYTALEMAEAFLKAGELDDALEALCEHLADHPLDAEALRLRGRLYGRIGRASEALADYAAITQPEPDDHIEQANILSADGQAASAIVLLRDAHEAHPTCSRLAERLIRLLVDAGEVVEARRIAGDMGDMMQGTRSGWGWWSRAGDLAMMNDDPRTAAEYYGRAIGHFQRTADALSPVMQNVMGGWYCARAAAYIALDAPEAALRDYRTAAELIPDDASIRFQIGLLIFQHGDAAERDGGREMARDAWRAMSPLVRAHAAADLDPAIRQVLELT